MCRLPMPFGFILTYYHADFTFFNSILIISSTVRFSTTSVSCWTEISLDSLQPLMFVLKKLLLDFPLFTGAHYSGAAQLIQQFFVFFKCRLLILVLQTQSKGLAIHSKSLLTAGFLKMSLICMIDWDSILYGRCESIHRSLAVLSMCISHLWSHCCITDPPKKLLMYLICECLPFVFSIEKSICGNVRHYLWIFTSQCHRVHAGPFYECLQFVQNIKSCAHVSCCAKGFPWLVTLLKWTYYTWMCYATTTQIRLLLSLETLKKCLLRNEEKKTKQHDFAQLKCIPLHCFLLSISVLSVNRHQCGSNMITDE